MARDITSPKTKYRRTEVDGKSKPLHRHVMEQALGRELAPTEYVHHDNHNKLDNRLENLILTNPVDHGRHHHLRKPLDYVCVICGATYTPPKTKRGRYQTCGPVCRLKLQSQRAKRIPDETIDEVRRRRLAGEKLAVLAAEYGLSQAHISEVARGVARTY